MARPPVKPFHISFSSPETNSKDLTIHFVLKGKVGRDVTYFAVQQYIEVHAEDIAGGLVFHKVRGLMAISASHEFVGRHPGVVKRLKSIVEGLYKLYEG